jgi:hypothetical protein
MVGLEQPPIGGGMKGTVTDFWKIKSNPPTSVLSSPDEYILHCYADKMIKETDKTDQELLLKQQKSTTAQFFTNYKNVSVGTNTTAITQFTSVVVQDRMRIP